MVSRDYCWLEFVRNSSAFRACMPVLLNSQTQPLAPITIGARAPMIVMFLRSCTFKGHSFYFCLTWGVDEIYQESGIASGASRGLASRVTLKSKKGQVLIGSFNPLQSFHQTNDDMVTLAKYGGQCSASPPQNTRWFWVSLILNILHEFVVQS